MTHTGVALDLGTAIWDSEQLKLDSSVSEKESVIRKIREIKPSKPYIHAFKRWKSYLTEANHCSLETVTTKRMRSGSSEAASNPLELSVALDATYGMPVLFGSTLKGITRHYAYSKLHLAEIGASNETTKQKQQMYKTVLMNLFGDDSPSDFGGCVIFHDAWWNPGDGSRSPFSEKDGLTPHHRGYYDGSASFPSPKDEPASVPRIVVNGRFLLAIEGNTYWREKAMKLLTKALADPAYRSGGHVEYGIFS